MSRPYDVFTLPDTEFNTKTETNEMAKGSFTLAAAKEIFFPSRMGNIGLYGAVHMETCSKGNSKGVIINWVLCPIVMAMATTKFPLPLPQLSVNEP